MPKLANQGIEAKNNDPEEKGAFTSLEFRNLLLDSSTEITGLRRFCKACKRREAAGNTTYDVVKAYITTSPECSELFGILEKGRRTVQELSAIFECFLNVLVRTAGDLKDAFPNAGYTICNLFLQHHTHKLYQCIEVSYKHKTIALTLRLLTAMVMQSRDTAGLVASQVDFNMQCFKRILKTDKKEKPDHKHFVRVAYIRFVLSFFMSGDAKTSQRILEVQGFVSCIFKGLIDDPASLIKLFLTTLRDKVVKNMSVSKTAKIRLFSEPGVLLSTAKLFDWDGVMDVELKDSCNYTNPKEFIHQMAYDFLYHTCCPFKYGINFKDKSLGTSGRSQNHILLRFINNLRAVTTAALAQDLVVRILESCPDLLSSYMTNLHNSMAQPEATERWLGLCDLVRNIYNAQPDIALAATAQSKNGSTIKSAGDIQTLVDMTIPGIFPPVMNQLFQKRCFKHKSWQVREKIMEMLMNALDKASATFDFISNPGNWPASSNQALNNEAYLASLKRTITENCVNIGFIVHVWSDYCKTKDDDSLRSERLATQVLCRCQELFPEYKPRKSFDIMKLLFATGRNSDNRREPEANSDDDVTLSILRLFAKHPENYKWFKVVESGRTPFYQVLFIISRSKGTQSQAVHSEALGLLKQIVAINDILGERYSTEADVWLECLPSLKDGDEKAVAVMTYVQGFCSALVRRPLKYTSAIASLRNRSETVQAGDDPLTFALSGEWWKSLPEVEIETVPLSYVMGAKKLGDQDRSATVVDSRPLSLMVAAGLMDLQSGELSAEGKESVDGYLAEVFFRIFHSLRSANDASFFAKLFLDGDRSQCVESGFPMLKNFVQFLSLWTGEACAVWSPVSLQGPDIRENIQEWFWNACAKSSDRKNTKIFDQAQMDLLKSSISTTDLLASSVQWRHDPPTRQLYDVIKQMLLYFDTLISTHHDQTGSVAVRVIDGIHFLLQEIFAIVGQLVEGSSDEPAEHSDASFLHCVVSDFLKNPSVKNIFLTLDGQPSEIVHKASSAAVEVMEKFFHLHPDCNKDLFEEYFTKVEASVVEIIKFLAGQAGVSDLSAERNNLFLSSFKCLCSCMPSVHMKNILTELGKALSSPCSEEAVPYFCEILCLCLSSLTCSAKITKTHLGLGEKNMAAIFTFLVRSYPKRLYENLFPILTDFCKAFPHVAVVVSKDVVDFCCKNIRHGSVQLLLAILKQNPVLTMYLVESLGAKNPKPAFRNVLDAEGRMEFIPVLANLLAFCKLMEKELRVNLYKSVSASYLSKGRHFDQNKTADFLCLITSFESEDFLSSFLTLLKKACSDFVAYVVSTECPGTLDAKLSVMQAARSISVAGEGHGKASTNVEAIYVCMCHILVDIPKAKDPDKKKTLNADLSTLSKAVRELDQGSFDLAAGRMSSIWGKFLRKLLKNQFGNPHSLQAITQLLDVMYTEEGTARFSGAEEENHFNVSDLKQLLASHSEFLPIMLAEKELPEEAVSDNDKGANSVKTCLTKLYYTLCLMCDAAHLTDSDVRILLGAYRCTLSFSDQNILNTLVAFERKGVLDRSLKPYLWGEKAALSFRAAKNLGDGLWKKPNSNQVLTCIEASIMERTLQRFPIRRRMFHVCDIAKGEYFRNDPLFMLSPAGGQPGDFATSSQSVYDPCFFLPTLLDLLKPEHLLDPQLFLRSGALSFVFACLASHCPSVRSLSVAILGRFYRHCESAWFPEKNLTMYLIHAVRNSLSVHKGDLGSVTVSRIPSSVANFLAAIVKLSQTPENHMYAVLHRFLLVKPRLDLKVVPEFFVLFFSADMEYKTERSWILNLVANGIRDMGDFHAVDVRNAFRLLMSFHDSPLCDNHCRRQVFQILGAACMVRAVAFHLTKVDGMISWLDDVACAQPSSGGVEASTSFDPDKRQDNTVHILNVVSSIWKTVNYEMSPEESLPAASAASSIPHADKEEQEDDSDAQSSGDDNMQEGEGESADHHSDRNNNGVSSTGATSNITSRKRATAVPFRIVEQIIKLTFHLLKNLLQANPCDSSSIHEAVAIIASCVHDIKKRRSRRKNADRFDSGHDSVLLPWEVEILHEAARFLDEVVGDEVVKTRLILLEVFSAWRVFPENATDRDLAGRCIDWCLKKPFKIFLTENGSEEILRMVMEWIRSWLPVLSADQTTCVRKHLLQRYSDICEAMSPHSSRCVKLIECVAIMNSIVMNGQHDRIDGEDSFSQDTLTDMNRIRLNHLD